MTFIFSCCRSLIYEYTSTRFSLLCPFTVPRLEPGEDTTAFPWKRWWSAKRQPPTAPNECGAVGKGPFPKGKRARKPRREPLIFHPPPHFSRAKEPLASPKHTQAAAKSATGAGSVSDRATIAEVSRRERCPVAPACVSRKAFVRSVEQDQSRRAGWLQSEKSPSRKERRATRLDAAVN